MVDLIDPTLRSSKTYKTRQSIAFKASAKYMVLILVFLCICYFMILIVQSNLDTKAQNTIEVSPTLNTEPGSESPTGRVPSIPKTPLQN